MSSVAPAAPAVVAEPEKMAEPYDFVTDDDIEDIDDYAEAQTQQDSYLVQSSSKHGSVALNKSHKSHHKHAHDKKKEKH